MHLQGGSLGDHVSFKSWSTPEELEQKIFETIAEETCMTDLDDVQGFDISIGGTLIKVDELANTLQACVDCGAKKVLLPAVSMIDFATVPADLMSAFQLIPYQSAEDAVFKALGVE